MKHKIDAIETPAFIVNTAIAHANINRFQRHCDTVGLRLRPHIKTHKLVDFAKAQMAAGAIGITCQKISEAEIMATGGLDDILITFNILGAAKLQRLRALQDRVTRLMVVADNEQVVAGLAATFAGAPKSLGILVECDTGARRCGVQTPKQALSLALSIAAAHGLTFAGLMVYPPVGGQAKTAEFMTETTQLLAAAGLACPMISSGGSPDMWTAATDDIITEYRIGTYIYNDRSLVARGVCTWDDCAAHVLATVVSAPTADRVVIDAGSKALTSDLMGFSDYGQIVGYPDARIVTLSEEHGVVSIASGAKITVGQRIQIVPNHVCVVSNMFDTIWMGTDGDFVQHRVDARGCVT
jgi:D-serine deaminase-like pyridoxal phosphate-dependent protein